MKKMVIALALFGFLGATAQAAETIPEKAAATGNDAGRAVNKGVNRTKEAVCMENDAKCLAKKAGNRVEEGAEYGKDKAKEVKNKVD